MHPELAPRLEAIAREIFLEVDYGSPPNAVKAACLDVIRSHAPQQGAEHLLDRIAAAARFTRAAQRGAGLGDVAHCDAQIAVLG